MATNGDPKQRHIFKKRISNFHSTAECLTCLLNNQTVNLWHDDPSAHMSTLYSGDNCLYNTAFFSPNSDYYILECLGNTIPMTYVKSTENKHIQCIDSFIFHEILQ
jgi:hypothetical protein